MQAMRSLCRGRAEAEKPHPQFAGETCMETHAARLHRRMWFEVRLTGLRDETQCGSPRKLYNEKDMVRDGYFYALGLGAVAMLLWLLTRSAALTSLPVLLALFFLWFFRDPERTIPTGPGEIVSPGDGVVTEADWIETAYGNRLRLSIFLNVFDVHVNRSPVAGTVKVVEHREGAFLNAMKPESVIMNEQTLVVIDAGTYEVSYKQIAGLLARRIVCAVKVGDHVERGQRVGMIKFGSRVDVLLPADAVPHVKTGARVRGGSTVLAVLPQPAGDAPIVAAAVVS
jgi:phosphatidylserine decarboxylase